MAREGSASSASSTAAHFTPCASPIAYKKLKLGRHKFEVRAVDRAGNKDETPATASFKATAGKSGKFKK